MHRRIAPLFWWKLKKHLQILGILLLILLILMGLFRSYTVLHPQHFWHGTNVTLEPLENLSANTGEVLQFTVRGADPRGETLSYHASPLPRGAQMDERNGTFIWKPATNQSGAYRITLTATNGRSIAEEQIIIWVYRQNHPPVLQPMENLTLWGGDRMELFVNASDPDGDPLEYTLSNIPPGATFDNRTRVLGWQIPANLYGTGMFSVTVSDGWDIAREFVQYTVIPLDVTDIPRPRPLSDLLGYLPEEDLAPLLRDISRPVHMVSPGLGPALQEQIAMASPGDIILVYPGTYHGRINVDQSLLLLGVDNPVIDAGGTGSVISLTTGGATVAGFTLVNSGTQAYDSGIKVSSSSNRILNNRISGHQYGVNLLPLADGNVIRNNTITNSSGEGIHGENLRDKTTIDSNLILNHKGDGIHIEYSWNVTLRNNTIAFNGGNGITFNYSHWTRLEGNLVESNSLDGAFIASGARDIIEGNTFSLNGNNGLFLEHSLDPTLRGDQIEEFSPSEYLNLVQRNACTGNDRAGIHLREITATVDGNVCTFNSNGIRIVESASLLIRNRASRNGIGFYLISTEWNVLRDNQATENQIGIALDGRSLQNVISANNVSSNGMYGFWFGPRTEGNLLRDNRAALNAVTFLAQSDKNIFGTNEFLLAEKEEGA